LSGGLVFFRLSFKTLGVSHFFIHCTQCQVIFFLGILFQDCVNMIVSICGRGDFAAPRAEAKADGMYSNHRNLPDEREKSKAMLIKFETTLLLSH
jgi:hypothetical protein